jgi:hypothetical protein
MGNGETNICIVKRGPIVEKYNMRARIKFIITHFRYPLCGKQVTVKHYYPETYDDKVEIIYNRGFGGRMRFESIGSYSIDEFLDLRIQMGNLIQRIARAKGFTDKKKYF